MLLKPEPLFAAVEALRGPETRVILMTPQGKPFKQAVARELAAAEHLLILCGHYEGVDHRVIEALVDEEISIGDYILTNGALAAAVVCDAVIRLLPGALGRRTLAGGRIVFRSESPGSPGLHAADRIPRTDGAGGADFRAPRENPGVERGKRPRPHPPEPPGFAGMTVPGWEFSRCAEKFVPSWRNHAVTPRMKPAPQSRKRRLSWMIRLAWSPRPSRICRP